MSTVAPISFTPCQGTALSGQQHPTPDSTRRVSDSPGTTAKVRSPHRAGIHPGRPQRLTSAHDFDRHTDRSPDEPALYHCGNTTRSNRPRPVGWLEICKPLRQSIKLESQPSCSSPGAAGRSATVRSISLSGVTRSCRRPNPDRPCGEGSATAP